MTDDNIETVDPYEFAINKTTTVKLFTIKRDGTIERGPGFTTVDEMSLEFWNAVNGVCGQFVPPRGAQPSDECLSLVVTSPDIKQ